MPPKRLGNGHRDQILNMKRKKTERDGDSQIVADGESAASVETEKNDFEFEASTAAEMLEKILREATSDDILLEYLWFLRKLPPLLNNQQSDLIHLVKTELGVAGLDQKLCGRFKFKGKNFPILEALSCKIKVNLRNIIVPPTTSCLLCKKDLVANNKPANVPLHTSKGPELASKFAWECKACRAVEQFHPGQLV